MPLGEALDDDYVISLLKRGAAGSKTSNPGSFPARSRAKDAPKPNTTFLRNIIRETDSHNAALKAKEAEESQLKLRELKRAERGGKRRRGEEDDGRAGKKAKGGERDGRWASALAGLGGASVKPRERRGERDIDGRSSASTKGPERPRDWVDVAGRTETTKEGRVRSRTDGDGVGDRSSRRRRSSVANDESGTSPPPERRKARPARMLQEPHQSDSDPLEAIIGPAPAPKVRSRGRGAQSASTMDDRFASGYDPKADVALHGDLDPGDWNMALEALRDRAKWQAKQGERLKAAGFTEDEVKRWEDGKTERDIDDVRWSKKGEDREWDRGKALDEEGRLE
ncbi:hypothetical protein LTR53_015581, partial [Teratosphaeriaceae sp. CCFEE 6253]